ncbi:MAG: MBL fold metallo-hydrolase [Flavobacteriales bacterium]|nr:MBL fold metallo-hydrolase [Flavobacteriales bacterium]
MIITFLGTGTSQGVPLIACNCEVCTSEDFKNKRLRTSVMLEVDNKVFVFDSGPDFRQQMLREKVERLDALIFTHEHKDHVAGLDDVRAFNYVLKRNIDVYVTDNVEVALRREFHYIFSDIKYPGIPKINIHKIKNEPFKIDGVNFIPIQVMHYKLPVLGFRVGDFTYITDASEISEKEKKKIIGSKVLVLNALRKEKHISHFTLDEAIALMKELAPEKGYLIHISHQLGTHEEVSKTLPDFIELAYDGLQVKLV